MLQQEYKTREKQQAERKRKLHARELSQQMEQIRKIKEENERKLTEERAKAAIIQTSREPLQLVP